MKHPQIYIPYRYLVPKIADNPLVGCRAFPSDDIINSFFNLISHRIAIEEAVGTVAAIAVKNGIKVRNGNYGTLQQLIDSSGCNFTGENQGCSWSLSSTG